MLTVNKIKAVYSDVVLALAEVSLQVQDASIVVLLGSNGSGKSTTLKSISGILRTEDGELTEGNIKLDDKRIDRQNPEEIARLGVCHILQGSSVFPQLTIEENLLMGAYLRRDRHNIKRDLAQVYEYFPKLAPYRRQRSGYLSGGEQQMLVIGRGWMAHPKIMLLDEPSLGLAPTIINDIFVILKKINEEEKTSLFIAEQNAMAALAIADYGYVLQNGRVASDGPAGLLMDHQKVKGSYLGLNKQDTFVSYHKTHPSTPDYNDEE
jgi:branched-chain amino acid transport system ATP-binding protein